MLENSESAWERIESEGAPKKVKVKASKNKNGNNGNWENPLQEKYNELVDRYGRKYGFNDGSIDCERLLDDLRAFERVFLVMKWNKFPRRR